MEAEEIDNVKELDEAAAIPQTPEVEVTLPETPAWEELGDFESVKAELDELRKYKQETADLPMEKLSFLKKGGDPIEALKQYEVAFQKNYDTEDGMELVKAHLKTTGKTERQVNLLLADYEDMDEDLDDDFEDKKALFESYQKEARDYFKAEQQAKRTEYENGLQLGVPEALKNYLDTVTEMKLSVQGEIPVAYNVPAEYLTAAKEALESLPNTSTLPQEQYQKTVESILWLNEDVRAKLIAAAVKAAVKQTEAKFQAELQKKDEERKAAILKSAGINTPVTAQVARTTQVQRPRNIPNITV